MKKRSLFLSVALGLGLTLTAASPTSLAIESSGVPSVSYGAGARLPGFTGVPAVSWNLNDVLPGTNPVNAQTVTAMPGNYATPTGMWKVASTGKLRALLRYRKSWTQTGSMTSKFLNAISEIPTTGTGGEYPAVSEVDEKKFGGWQAVWTPKGYFMPEQQTMMGIPIACTYNVFNPKDWSLVKQYDGNWSLDFPAMTYNERTGEVDVCYLYGKEVGFGSFDIMTGVLTKKKVFAEGDNQWTAMSYGKDGKLFAIDTKGNLLDVNPQTGDFTVVGNMGMETPYPFAAAYDKKADVFYLVMNGRADGAGLASLNTETAKLDMIYVFNDKEQFSGAYVDHEIADADAPAAVTDLKVIRDNGSLTVDVNFKMPVSTYGDNKASGPATYKIFLNGKEMKSGTSQFGNTESVQVTAEEDGYYSVCVIAYNDKGQGEPTIIKTYIGHDILQPVPSVTMSYDGSKFNVSWEKPEPTYGGYIDYSEVTYTITRMPNNVVVADNIHETSYTDVYEIPSGSESYYFDVVANYRGRTTTPTSSNAEVLGILAPPFIETFDTQERFNRFTTFSLDSHVATWNWIPKDGGYTSVSTFWVDSHDEWLISPAIQVEAGKTYQISVDMAARKPDTPENCRVWVGDECDPAKMTTKVIEHAQYVHLDFQTQTGDYTATKDGMIYIGVQAYTEGVKGNTVKIDNLAISAPVAQDAPDVVTDVQINAADYGKLEATISFNAPTLDISGKKLNSIDKVQVLRNGKEIKSLSATPGQSLSFVDANEDGGMVNGNNTYEFIASNGSGVGRSLLEKAYIGCAAPVAPVNVAAIQNDKPNKVTVTWDAVTTDVNGKLLPLEGVTYTVGRYDTSGNGVPVYTGSDLKFTDEPCEEDADQTFIYYGVYASVAGYTGEATGTMFTAVGKPYSTPWTESFAGKGVSSLCASISPNQHYGWSIYNDADVIGMTSSDGDDGMAIMASDSEDTGVSGDIIFGFVDLSKTTNPYLLFDFYGYNSKNTISVLVNDGNGFKEAETFSIGDGKLWTRKAISLKNLPNKKVQVAFRGTINDNPLIAIDNLRITDVYDNDLKAVSLNALRKVKPGQEVTVALTYSNEGINAAKDYSVSFLRNGEEIANVKGKELKPGQQAEVSVKTTLSILDREDVAYKAVIDYASDADKNNNEAECVIGVDIPDYPVANNLSATRDGNQDVVVEWSDPDLSQTPYEATIDGAETYPAYSIGLPHSTVSGDDLGDWTVIDGDGGKTISLKNYDYANEGEAMAWMAFNNVKCGLGDEFPAYEGEQMFVCFVPGDKQADDWLISPELIGSEQTFSFMAKSVLDDGADEDFEVYYSTTGKNREDFKQIGEKLTTAKTWNNYSFDLPEGAKYFAIRCVSLGSYALSVDNIRFVKAGAARMNLAVNGYNIYRNSKLVNAEPVVENSYLDKDPEARKACKYEVTVVYDRGESAPCDAVTVAAASGVAQIGGGVKVSVDGNTLVVAGAEGQRLTIFSASGLVVTDIEAAAVERINLAKGVYTLRVGKRAVKVLI